MTDIRAAARRIFEDVLPAVDEAAVPELVAPDFVNHEAPSGMPQGRAGVVAIMRWLESAASEQRCEVHQVLADGDTVAVYCTMSGRHTGEFMGIPATGRRFAGRQVHLLRFADGLAAEHWAVRDDATVLRQLSGELPEPAAQPA